MKYKITNLIFKKLVQNEKKKMGEIVMVPFIYFQKSISDIRLSF